MSGPNLISPLLDGFVMGPPISSHHGIRCCPAMMHNSENKYIVKIISVPASQAQMDALLLAGAYKDPGDALDNFRSLADGITKEADLLSVISEHEGFLPYIGHQIVPMGDNRLGYLVYLLSSYKRSLDKYARRDAGGALKDVLKLGIDMCAALSACRDSGHLYIALKPTNIFLSEDKEFRIGDIGFVPLPNLSHTSLPPRYRSAYCAPEILDPLQTLNRTVDTYALGMILYQICNEGKLPAASAPGEKTFPMPRNGTEGLRAVIMKAVSPNVDERFADPKQMMEALSKCVPDDVRIYSPGAGPAPIDSDTQIFSPEAVNSALSNTQAETKILPTGQIQEYISTPSPSDTRIVPTDEIKEAIRTDADKDKNVAPVVTETVTSDPVISPQETKVLAAASFSSAPADLTDDASEEPASLSPHPEYDLLDTEDNESDLVRMMPKEPRRVRKPIGKAWIVWLIVLILLAGIGYGGYYYYTNYYLQTIDALTVSGEQDHLTVYVETQVDPEILTVTCSDTYGNSMKSKLYDGKADFDGLLPNSQYKISIEIEGFHQLNGKTTDVFNTETKTEIVSFSGITGSEDGSAMLTFTVDGPEPEKWILTYSAEDVEPHTEEFTGHSITIRGLDYPKVYTFTLTPSEEMFVTGQTSMEFNSTALILARDLTITSCYNGEMAVRWDPPTDTVVENWTVRCYSDGGYDQTLTTNVCSAKFLQLDPGSVYYVEVTAAGMTQPVRTSITADPITITDLKIDLSDLEALVVSWDYVGNAPDGGWLLMYSLDGSNTQSVVKCSGPSAKITPRVYGAEYTFVIQAADNTSIFENEHIYRCPEPDMFEDHSFDVTRTTVDLFVTPEKEGWTSIDVDKEDHTDSFHVGEKISILLFCDNRFYIPSADISILYVIRDSNGKVIGDLISHDSRDWHEMWVANGTNDAELDLPIAPSAVGEYTLSIYFNGYFVASAEFSVNE